MDIGKSSGKEPESHLRRARRGHTGLGVEIMQREELLWLRRQLRLDREFRVLCISTEGDIDRENYRKIVGEGAYTNLPR